MADEVTTGSAASELVATIVSAAVKRAAYAATKLLPLCGDYSPEIAAAPGVALLIPKWPKLTAAVITEGTGLANTAVNTSSRTLTVVGKGIMITVTDLMISGNVIRNLPAWAAQLGAALAELLDSDLAAEFADFATAIGSTGVNLSEVNFLSAIYELELGNALGDLVAVLHPIQVDDLRKAIVASTGAVWGASGGPGEIARVGKGGALYGVPIFSSSVCASVNTDADRQGAMFPLGRSGGMASAFKWEPRTEFERDASLPGTEIVVTAAHGDECVDTATTGGVKIVTDHE